MTRQAKLEQKRNIPNYKSVRKIYKTLERGLSSDIKTASDLANSEIVSVKPDTTRKKAAKIMKENDFSQLPVKKENDYVGIVLSKDIGLAKNNTLVEKIMRPTIPIIPESTPREAVAELLKSENAVLVKGNQVGGIITSADLL